MIQLISSCTNLNIKYNDILHTVAYFQEEGILSKRELFI